MTTYKVWIEIEAYDTEAENGRTIDALHFAATGDFPTLDEATGFADQLNAFGEMVQRQRETVLPDGFSLVDKP